MLMKRHNLLQLVFSRNLQTDPGRGRAVGLGEEAVSPHSSRQIKKKTTRIHIFDYPALPLTRSHHQPWPGLVWAARQLEGGRMYLSPPTMKTCHFESMQ